MTKVKLIVFCGLTFTGLLTYANQLSESFAGNYKSLGNCDVHIEAGGKDLLVSLVRLPQTGFLNEFHMPDCGHPSNYFCTGETSRYTCKGRVCGNGATTMTLLKDGNIFFEWPKGRFKSIKSDWLNYYWCPKK